MKVGAIKHLDHINYVLPVFKSRDLNSFITKVAIFARHAIDGEYLFFFKARRTEIILTKDPVEKFYASALPGVNLKLAKRIRKKYSTPLKLLQAIEDCGVHNPPKGGKSTLMKRAWFSGIKGIALA